MARNATSSRTYPDQLRILWIGPKDGSLLVLLKAEPEDLAMECSVPDSQILYCVEEGNRSSMNHYWLLVKLMQREAAYCQLGEEMTSADLT